MGGPRPSPLVSRNLLASADVRPGFLTLLCADHTVYLSRRYELWRRPMNGAAAEPLAAPEVSWLRRQASRVPYLRRLGRLWVREMLQADPEHLLAVVQRRLIRCHRVSGETQEVLRVEDGGRPKGLLLTPEGLIFSGEYWDNPQRRPLRIWGSADAGQSWDLAHSLPAGAAKHIHNLVWDEYRRGIWVFTGDADGESAFLFTPDLFRTVTEVFRGGQLSRAVHCFCRPEGLYYSTDTEREQNWVVFFDTKHLSTHKIQPMPGSSIYAARMANRYFISTLVEPSRVNHYRYAVLWSSPDLHTWEPVVEFKKDWLPGEYFGFGSILLPRVQGDCPLVIFTALAVKHFDFTTFIIEPDQFFGADGGREGGHGLP